MKPTVPILIALASTAALAGPVPPPTPVRKPVPAGMTADNIKLYVQGIVADKAGDPHDAIRKFEDAAKEAGDFAAAHYNIADVYRRMEQLDRAIKEYKKYLELAPDAADKKDVERLIDQLANADFTAVLDGAEPGAVIYLDGKLLGASPQVVHVPPGEHVADRISPTGHRHANFEGKPGRYEHVILDDWSAKKVDGPPGNVVLSKSGQFNTSGSWKDKVTNLEFEFPGRMTLPPGHYVTQPWNEERLCSPIVFDVPRGSAITYVYVDVEAKVRGGKCQDATTRVQTVKGVP